MSRHADNPDTIKARKIGILMPVYNLGDYIDDALASLDSQTFKDFSLLIVDDASTDKQTINKLKELERNTSHTIVYEKINAGLAALASRHLPKIDAEYLVIVSPDDILEPTYLEETATYLDKNPNTAAAGSYLSMFGERTGIINPTPSQYTLPAMLIENSFLGSALVRRSVLESVNWLGSERNHEDYLLWLSALEKGYTLHLIQKPLFRYRIRSSSMSNSFSREKNRQFEKKLVDQYPALYKEHASYVIKNKIDRIDTVESDYDSLEALHEDLANRFTKLQLNHDSIESELALIKSSRIYKLLALLRPNIPR